jgi:DNA-binding PadR family transcriptional regulator
VARGDVGLGVDLGAAAEERGISKDSPHLATLTDYMEVAGWIEADTAARVRRGDPLYRITERGVKVLREGIG